MEVGDAITNTSVKHRENDENGKMVQEFTFKVSERGSLFNFIFIGVSDPKSGPIDPDTFLRSAGWVPLDEVEKLKPKVGP